MGRPHWGGRGGAGDGLVRDGPKANRIGLKRHVSAQSDGLENSEARTGGASPRGETSAAAGC